jgi:poly-beta-1,6-N-acetyl-D-glucosamine N-deacetylase
VTGNSVKIPTEILARQMRLLLRLGALNFGYYPDDFIAGHPDEHLLHREFSLQSYPYLK